MFSKTIEFLEKSWTVIRRISSQSTSSANVLRFICTFSKVEYYFIKKITAYIDGIVEDEPLFYRRLEYLRPPLLHIMDFYR